MQPIPVSEACGIAPPRRPAVLCLPGPDGSTDLIATQWFTWLNLKRNPMLSYALERSANLGLNVETDGVLYLAFPPVKDALIYQKGVRTASVGQEKKLPKGAVPCKLPGVPVEVPQGSELVLRCTLAGAYNYPFKKARICNCNLEEAWKEDPPDDSGLDQPPALV